MMDIIPDKPSYAPGETVVATAKLDIKSPVANRRFTATLTCYEYSKIPDKDMKQTSAVHTEKLFELGEDIAGKGRLAGGKYYISITLPKNAPPTSHQYGKDGKAHTWIMHVKLDIPLAPDENAEKEIIVSGIGDE